MNEIDDQIEGYLLPFGERISSLAQELRKIVIRKTKPKFELVGDSTISVNIGYGFTKKAWDCYCAIIVYSKHVNISFPSGALLSDPKGLLVGTGKRIRHIKISNAEDLNNPEVHDLIKEARKIAIEDLEEDYKESETVITLVKTISGIKKRPNNS
ncbi:MAG: DUF1801 domain-containing protein [Cytophagales bacterium]